MAARTTSGMTERHTSKEDRPGAGHYEIRLTGHLDARWAAWFDGLTVSHEGDGTTVISGPIADQAALHGLLQRVRDLGLPLVSVTRDETDPRLRSGQARQMWQMPNRKLASVACLRQSQPQQGARE
jgi:hypothetical protein